MTRPTPHRDEVADVIALFDAATDFRSYMQASHSLSAIPTAALSDVARADIWNAMIRALARTKTMPE
jgi:hypothetical protein